MNEYDLDNLIIDIERSVRIRFLVSMFIVVLSLFSLIIFYYRYMSATGVTLAEFSQVSGTVLIGTGIAVGLLTAKASASISLSNLTDGRVLKLNKKYNKNLARMNDFSVLLTVIGTFWSGYSIFLG